MARDPAHLRTLAGRGERPVDHVVGQVAAATPHEQQLPTMQVMSDVCAYVRRVRPPPISEQHSEFVMSLRELHRELQALLTVYYGGLSPRRPSARPR